VSQDTPADPPEWQTGPPPDYDPPPLEDLIDPEIPARIAATGRDLVLAVLAEECGIHKTETGWTRETPDRGETP
jgi:hypothetical protein